MKIGGVDPQTLPTEELLVLPRGDKEIVFRATGIQSYDEFNTLCPEPKPPGKLVAGVGWEPNQDDPAYKDMMTTYNSRRIAWMVITSLVPSDIEWDTVDPAKPSTWLNWEKDMKESGLSQVECNRVTQLVFQANCLDEEKLKKAREVFLAGQGPVPSEFSGQNTEPQSSPSGEPVSE
jgi:hypothetical protein